MDVKYGGDITWREKKVEDLILKNLRSFHLDTSQHLVRRFVHEVTP
jgi:hypothetical protein